MRGRDYLSEARDNAVALRVVEIPLDGVNVLARGDGVGAGQDHLGPGLDNVCKMQFLNYFQDFNFVVMDIGNKKCLFFFSTFYIRTVTKPINQISGQNRILAF